MAARKKMVAAAILGPCRWVNQAAGHSPALQPPKKVESCFRWLQLRLEASLALPRELQAVQGASACWAAVAGLVYPLLVAVDDKRPQALEAQ